MRKKRYIIYALIDPRNGQCRYVGKSSHGLNRPKKHTSPYRMKQEKSHKGNWILDLHKHGLVCEIEILEEFQEDTLLYEAEQFWIAYLRFLGCNLTNHTDGGPGASGVRLSSKQKKKISQKVVALWQDPDYRQTTIKAQTEFRHSAAGLKASSDAGKMSWKNRPRKPFRDNLGNLYTTQKEAAIKLGISQGNICECLSGKRSNVHGYTFSYVSPS